MPVVVDRIWTSRKAGGTQGLFHVVVDSVSVNSLIAATNIAVSGPMLAGFMGSKVQPYFAEQIVDRFAYNGDGGIGGTWAPLKESTKRIRRNLGYTDDWAINERTGQMLHHLISSSRVTASPSGATLAIPGTLGDQVMTKKIQTAQHGWTGWNPMFQTVTSAPARPVLTVNGNDMTAVLTMLQFHVMSVIANRGASGLLS